MNSNRFDPRPIPTKNLCRPHRATRAVLAIGLLVFFTGVDRLAAQQPDLRAARDLLALPDREALEAVKKYNADEAEILTTQLLSLTRPANPDIDRVYTLVRHLETLRADAHAQNRLNPLLYVLALTLILFTAFLIYVIIDQRASLRALQKLLAGAPEKSPDNSSHSVYQGD